MNENLLSGISSHSHRRFFPLVLILNPPYLSPLSVSPSLYRLSPSLFHPLPPSPSSVPHPLLFLFSPRSSPLLDGGKWLIKVSRRLRMINTNVPYLFSLHHIWQRRIYTSCKNVSPRASLPAPDVRGRRERNKIEQRSSLVGNRGGPARLAADERPTADFTASSLLAAINNCLSTSAAPRRSSRACRS